MVNLLIHNINELIVELRTGDDVNCFIKDATVIVIFGQTGEGGEG